MENCWHGTGRLVRDVDMRYAGETPVISFTIAVDRDYKNKNGERESDFVDCEAWENLATFIQKNFHQGDYIQIVGPIKTRLYDDREGNKRKGTSVKVDKAYFCGGKKQAALESGTPASPEEPSSGFTDVTSDDIPF